MWIAATQTMRISLIRNRRETPCLWLCIQQGIKKIQVYFIIPRSTRQEMRLYLWICVWSFHLISCKLKFSKSIRFCHKCPMHSQKHPLAVSKYTSRVKENTTQSKQKIYKCSSSNRRIPRFRFDNMFSSMMFFLSISKIYWCHYIVLCI